jgi:hypothetical protein
MFIRPTILRSQDTDGSAPESTNTNESKQTFSVDYVRELRAENKAARLKAAEFEAALRVAQEEVTESKKAAEARVAEVQTESEARIVRSELKRIANAAGMHDLDGLKLADLSGVKLDHNGDVEGADALIAALKESKPYLFADVSIGVKSGTTSNTKPAPKVADQGPRNVRDISKDEYERAKAAMLRGQ